ncbi:MAG TPA: hypothetical protein VG345_14330 [Bryobacteraceae bacterium]|jgi:hypothetical protein|nr:hypothetical protein [Bryobacteraceae bacterium]
MAHHLGPLIMTFGGAAALFVYRRDIQDALERLGRRGPRPPSAPLPANDSFLLLRKHSRKDPAPRY